MIKFYSNSRVLLKRIFNSTFSKPFMEKLSRAILTNQSTKSLQNFLTAVSIHLKLGSHAPELMGKNVAEFHPRFDL